MRGEKWQLANLSTNGTFLNRESEPVGAGQSRELRDRDGLRLGGYEIAVRIAQSQPMAVFEPLAPLLVDIAEPPLDGPVQPDHAPVIEDAFCPPPVALLGDDWDLFGDDRAAPIRMPPPPP